MARVAPSPEVIAGTSEQTARGPELHVSRQEIIEG